LKSDYNKHPKTLTMITLNGFLFGNVNYKIRHLL
jgi:hypothetical protein